MGDSAGALLAVSLMKHIKMPVDAIAVKIPTGKVPKAAILISPWLNLNPKYTGSYARNSYSDKITFRLCKITSEAYQPDRSLRLLPEVSPYDTKEEDWKGVLPSEMLVVAGERETMFDDIVSWTLAAKVNPSCLLVEPMGIHDSFTLETRNLETYKENYSYIQTVAFLRRLLSEARPKPEWL
ncbi:hypothetical protein BABINDRAFT_158817 [Babjeviella inositovora NRRL Y-12698]|uniref:Alpha/beta hydrolase fold-3 domain-containing protein n=1 Tax=Babjeviella inositovora NRRL Y-12698 TaxID=984486 RepID=A0A1E3QWY1_9ASCO|nr:uncharacterized protein BABINDRAFT_158817 [Babjeviella inositovora NRRL Y-12698]ODQ82166.1 hypothetical protein BABINDRAFT_158817 [Babjeviella inositovora NRRL Y-12698]